METAVAVQEIGAVQPLLILLPKAKLSAEYECKNAEVVKGATCMSCKASVCFFVTLNAGGPFDTAAVLCTLWEGLTGTMRELLDAF